MGLKSQESLVGKIFGLIWNHLFQSPPLEKNDFQKATSESQLCGYLFKLTKRGPQNGRDYSFGKTHFGVGILFVSICSWLQKTILKVAGIIVKKRKNRILVIAYKSTSFIRLKEMCKNRRIIR